VTEPFAARQPRLWLIILVVTIAFLTVCLGYFRFFTNAVKKSPSVASPPIPVVSVCKELPPGMRRIGANPGDRYMLQFDIPETEVLIREGVSDVPPIVYGFRIKPKGSESRLWIS
jgi:flagellar basal body-associated protein FliL